MSKSLSCTTRKGSSAAIRNHNNYNIDILLSPYVIVALILIHLTPSSYVGADTSTAALYKTNNQGAYPVEDTFEYRARIFPEKYEAGRLTSIPQGAYFRVRLEVVGAKSSYQFLNLSKGEAGIMLIRRLASATGKENFCNSTAVADILQTTTDLNSADGKVGSNGQSKMGFATFLAPAVPFKLCYRKSVSRYTNTTRQSLNVTNFARGAIPGSWRHDLVAGRNPWEPLDFSAKYAWQNPYRQAVVSRNVNTSELFFSLPLGAYSGEYSVVSVHRNSSTYAYPLTATSAMSSGDVVKIIPAGSHCISEDSHQYYIGTALTTDGVWGAIGLSNLQRGGTTGSTTTVGTNAYNWHSGKESSSSSFHHTNPVAYLRMPTTPGLYEVCYSAYEERKEYAKRGPTSATQSPGWRKLFWNDARDRTTFRVRSRPNITFSVSEENALGWGWVRVRGVGLNTFPATEYDGKGNYLKSGPGDVLKLVPAAKTAVTDEFAVDGCWSRHLENFAGNVASDGPTSAYDLGHTPTDSVRPWKADGINQGTAYAYLRFPFGGPFSVCYRKANQGWRHLTWDPTVGPKHHSPSIHPRDYSNNITWSLPDTRAGTWASIKLTAASASLSTMPNPYTSPSPAGVALRIVRASENCMLASAQTRAETFDVGTAETARGEASTPSRLDDTSTLRSSVYAYVQVPPQDASGYRICVKVGRGFWYALPTLLVPTAPPNIRYTLGDTREGTLGKFLFVSTTSGSSMTASAVLDAGSSADEVRLIQNDTATCDRTSLLPDGSFDRDLSRYCYTVGSGPMVSSYSTSSTDECSFQNALEYVNYGSETSSLSATAAFITIPPYRTNMQGYKVCYRQKGLNWVELEPGFVTTRDPKVSTNLTTAFGGVVTEIHAASTQYPLSAADQLKFVRASDRCDYFAYEDCNATVVSSYTGGNLFRLTVPTTQNVTEAFRLCYRTGSSISTNWYPLAPLITIHTAFISYVVDRPVVAGATVKITFMADTPFLSSKPNNDAAKIVLFDRPCDSVNSAAEGVAWSTLSTAERNAGLRDLGPLDQDGERTTVMWVTLPLNSANDVRYRVCYRSSSSRNVWTTIPQEARATRRPEGSHVLTNGKFIVKASGIESVSFSTELFSLSTTTALLAGAYTSSNYLKVQGSSFTSGVSKFKFVLVKAAVRTSSCSDGVRYKPTGFTCNHEGTGVALMSGGPAQYTVSTMTPVNPGVYMTCVVPSTLDSVNYVLASATYLTVVTNNMNFRMDASLRQLTVTDTYSSGSPVPLAAPGLSTSDKVLLYPKDTYCGQTSPSQPKSIGVAASSDTLVSVTGPAGNPNSTLLASVVSAPLLIGFPPNFGDYRVCLYRASNDIRSGVVNALRRGTWYQLREEATGNEFWRADSVGGVVVYKASNAPNASAVSLGSNIQFTVESEGAINGTSIGGIAHAPMKFKVNVYNAPQGVENVNDTNAESWRAFDYVVSSDTCPYETSVELFGETSNTEHSLLGGKATLNVELRRACPPWGCRLYISAGPIKTTFTSKPQIATGVLLSPAVTEDGYHPRATLAQPHLTGTNRKLAFDLSAIDDNRTLARASEGLIVSISIPNYPDYFASVTCTLENGAPCPGTQTTSFKLTYGALGRVVFSLEFEELLTFATANTVQTLPVYVAFDYTALVNGVNQTVTNTTTIKVALRPPRPVFLNILDVYGVTSARTASPRAAVFRSPDFERLYASPVAIQNNVSAGAGHYLVANEPYAVVLQIVDEFGNPVSAKTIESERIVSTLTSTANNGNHITAAESSALAIGDVQVLGQSRVTVYFRVRYPCPVDNPCSVKFTTRTYGAVGYLNTPVRAKYTRLAFLGAVPTTAVAGVRIPDIAIGAVDEDGNIDEFNYGDVQPMVNNGKHKANLVSINAGLSGMQLRRSLIRGRVVIGNLTLDRVCLDTCYIEFASTWGGGLLRTPDLVVSTGIDRIEGTITPDPADSATRLTVNNPIFVTISARTNTSDVAVSATDWVWVQLVWPQLNPPQYLVDGGRFKFLERGAVTFNITLLAPCSDCVFRFQARPQNGHFSSNVAKGTWETPAISATLNVVPDRFKLINVTSTAPVPGYSGPTPWYVVSPNTYFDIQFAATNVHGHVAKSSSDIIKVRTTTTGFAGIPTLDGSGGTFSTFVPTHKTDGIQLVQGGANVKVMFSGPCLRCAVEFYSNQWTSLIVYFTVRPTATIVGLQLPTPVTSVSRRAYSGEDPTDTSVWYSMRIIATDANGIVDYTAGFNVSVSSLLPSSSTEQVLLCSQRYPCEQHHPSQLITYIRPRSILDMIAERTSLSTMAPGGSADIDVAGRLDDIVGQMLVIDLRGKLQRYVNSGVTITWTKSDGPSCLKVLDIAAFDPPRPVPAVHSAGHVLPGVYGALNYTVKGSIILGVPTPFTLQVLDSSGRRVPSFNGTIKSRLAGAFGCGNGLPDVVADHNMTYGNVTVWVTFRESCSDCRMEFTLVPHPQHDAFPRNLRTVTTQSFWVMPMIGDVVAVATPPGSGVVNVNQVIKLNFKRYAEVASTLVETYTGRSDVLIGFRNVVFSKDSKMGVASAGASGPYMYGNGGVLWTGQNDLLAVPTLNPTFADMHVMSSSTSSKEISIAFTRSCEQCRVEVSLIHRLTGKTSRFLLKTQTGHDFTVRVAADRTIIAGPLPAQLHRGVPFALTQWRSNKYGELDFGFTGTLTSRLFKQSGGGNGDGGVLQHTNGDGGVTESSWSLGTMIWRLVFTEACFMCTIQMDNDYFSVPVYTASDRLVVSGQTSTKMTVNSTVKFTVTAVDDEGNRDYFLGQFANGTDNPATSGLSVYLSSSSTGYVPITGKFGTGGSPVITGATIKHGIATVSMAIYEPVRSAYIIVQAANGASNALNSTLKTVTPTTITAYSAPTNVRVISNATVVGAKQRFYVGNVVRITALLADFRGFVTPESTTQFSMGVSGCTAQHTTYGGNLQSTDLGFATFDTTFTSLGDGAGAASLMQCVLTFTSTTSVLPSAASVVALGVEVSAVNATRLVYEAAPATFATSLARAVTLVAVDDDGRVGTQTTGTVMLSQKLASCGIVNTEGSTSAVDLSNGRVTYRISFSGTGLCSVGFSHGSLAAPPLLGVTVQRPKTLYILQNITSTADVLQTGTVYELPIEVRDAQDKLVSGASGLAAMSLTLSARTRSGADFTVRNVLGGTGDNANSNVGLTVGTTNGRYAFKVLFPNPTTTHPVRLYISSPGLPSVFTNEMVVQTRATLVRPSPTTPIPKSFVVGRTFTLTLQATDSRQPPQEGRVRLKRPCYVCYRYRHAEHRSLRQHCCPQFEHPPHGGRGHDGPHIPRRAQHHTHPHHGPAAGHVLDEHCLPGPQVHCAVGRHCDGRPTEWRPPGRDVGTHHLQSCDPRQRPQCGCRR